jgi:hypothetical protein
MLMDMMFTAIAETTALTNTRVADVDSNDLQLALVQVDGTHLYGPFASRFAAAAWATKAVMTDSIRIVGPFPSRAELAAWVGDRTLTYGN